MYLAGKNIGENLAVSKEVAILAVPRRRRFFESKTNIRFTADKAGFFFGRFLFGEVDVLADFQKSLASFVIYIQQIFVSIMPRRDKNLTADARTASASTPTARKTVSVTSRLTKAELIQIISTGHIDPPTLGWSIGGYWKGFSFNVLFQGSFDYSFAINGTGIESFKSQFQPIHTGRWTLERYQNGEEITFPRLTTNPSTINSASTYMSDFWLINAWYIRLKTIDLGYQLPKKVLPKYVDNIRFYVNAYNLLTFTGYDKYQQDPEIKTNTAGDAYMNQRVVNLGVQLTF